MRVYAYMSIFPIDRYFLRQIILKEKLLELLLRQMTIEGFE